MSWLRNLLGRGGGAGNGAAPIRIELPPLEEQTVYGDQPLRKAWAEDVLRAEGIPINPSLPMIEGEAEVILRAPGDVAARLLALVAVAFKASESPGQDLLESVITERGLRSHFTPLELAFIEDPEPSHHARAQFSWRCEAAWVLLWALRHIEGPLGTPTQACDVPFLSETVYRTADLAERGMQSANDILNEADLIYRYHWAVRQAGLDGTPPPGGLDPGVVMERHHALNWLIGYNDGAQWDDVTTDT